VSFLRTLVSSSRALVTGAKDLVRLREIAAVFWSHGFGWAVAQLKIRRELQVEADTGESPARLASGTHETGKRLVAALTELGPTWVKFGQILSTRPDVFPPEIIAELATLQDAVEPVSFDEIKGQLRRHLGADFMDRFASLEEQPLASASIGQVHRARLGDGREVVLKIQRPGIRPKIESDIHILATVAGYVEEAFAEAQAMDLVGMVHDFAKSLSQELDYRSEALNMERFRHNFRESSRVVIPVVHAELSDAEVLCMDFVAGKKFSEVIAEGADTRPIVQLYFDVAYKMLFFDGFFHGDLHPGNVFLVDGDKLALIDCGMVGRLAPSRKDRVIDILWAVLNEDLEGVARTFFDLAIPQGPVDYPAFEADAISVAERYIVGVPLAQIEIGALFGELVRGATRHRLRMPSDFTMMFKAILTTEGLAKSIAPDVDPVELARPYIQAMMTERYSPDRLKQVALADFQVLSGMARTLPRTIPLLLNRATKGELSFGISEASIERQHAKAVERAGRNIRAAFTLVLILCGTLALGVPGLPLAIWGIPWVSVVFWGLGGFWAFTLLRRGGLI
jgi:ubiquinone biosynthesis protein